MTWPPDSPNWEPIEQDWGNVKLVPTEPTEIMSMDDAVKGPLRADLASPADTARLEILENADSHVSKAVDELRQAVAWFSVVDRSDHAEVVRLVEGLADTIAYRLRNAGQ